MSAVLRLVKKDNTETVLVFEYLAELARKGELFDSAISIRWPDGREEAIFTGMFKNSQDRGAATAMRLSMTLAQLNGEYKGYPA